MRAMALVLDIKLRHRRDCPANDGNHKSGHRSSVMLLDLVTKLIVFLVACQLAETTSSTSDRHQTSPNVPNLRTPHEDDHLDWWPSNSTTLTNFTKDQFRTSLTTTNQAELKYISTNRIENGQLQLGDEHSDSQQAPRLFEDKVRQRANRTNSSREANAFGNDSVRQVRNRDALMIPLDALNVTKLNTMIPDTALATTEATSMGAPTNDNTSGRRLGRFVRTSTELNQPTAASTTSRNQQIQSLTGQRLIIPCRNATRSILSSSASLQSSDQPKLRTNGAATSARSRLTAQNNLNLVQFHTSGIALIVWHKDDQLNSPVFAVDARGTSIKDAKQQAISDSLKGRARVDLLDSSSSSSGLVGPPALIIDEARLEDAGLYTCTVEFDRAPTQTYQTTVGVSDPPKNMIIKDETNENQPLGSQLAGPYDEDSRLVLVCEAEPGQPEAGQVSWWQLDSVTLLSGDMFSSSSHSLRPQSSSADSQNHHHHRHHLPPLIPADTASHLTTLNLDKLEPISGSSAASFQLTSLTDLLEPGRQGTETTANSPLQPARSSRDFYLGPRSFHNQQQDQQLVAQLAASNLTNALIQSSASVGGLGATVRLRHWRRLDNNRTELRATSSGGSDSQRVISNRLEIQQLTRANLGDEFLCLAVNNQFSPPLNSSLSIDLNLKPTEVRLANKSNATFKLGQKTIVECHVMGSKPSPTIKWFRGQQEIEITKNGYSSSGGSYSKANSNLDYSTSRSQLQQTTNPISEFNRDTNNLTKISYLTLTPEISDNQQPLTCSASNQKLSNRGGDANGDSGFSSQVATTLSDSIIMNVQFKPRLSLKLGAGISPDSIKLQGDIFMDCEIGANPPIQELTWLHESQPLSANISLGIIMSNQSLVLRNIGVNQRGAYECQARNSLGSSNSNKLILKPRFEPICDETLTKHRYEIPLNQPTRIECHVLAEPEQDLHFTWRFNRTSSGAPSTGSGSSIESNNDDQNESLISSDELGELASDTSSTTPTVRIIKQYETNFTKSTVIFTPRSRRHFGQLLCSASNSMGKQERPCTIELVQSETPEPVLGCFVDNQTQSSFSIHCQPPASTSSGPVAVTSVSSLSPYNKQHPTGGTQYILELYTSEQSSRTNERGSPVADSAHLALRQPNDGQPAQASSSSYDYEDETSADQAEQQRQTRVRRLTSELPSFDVLDLKPNSTYNILIYVQNSKGRSAAAHHQVSTKPFSGNSQLASDEMAAAAASTTGNVSEGRLELIAKRTKSSSPTASSQLLSFLKIDNYFIRGPNGEPPRQPLVGVALIVLLSTISIVMVVFFVNRLICSRYSAAVASSSSSADRKLSSKRKSSSGGRSWSSSPPSNEDDEEEEMTFMKRKPTNNNRSLTTNSDKNDQNQGIGSGSDTSRETNTDSTLISSPPTSTQTKPREATNSSCHEQPVSDFYCNNLGANSPMTSLAQVSKQKRCSHNDLSQLTATNLMNSHSQQHQANYIQSGQFRSTTLRPRTSFMFAGRPSIDDGNQLNYVPQQQQVSYSTNRMIPTGHHSSQQEYEEFIANQADGGQLRVTPQMSLHSSECSSNSVDMMPNHHHHHCSSASTSSQLQRLARHNYLVAATKSCQPDQIDHEHLDMGELAGITDSGVYVISDGSSEHQQGASVELIDASTTGGYWCQAGTASSIDSNNRQIKPNNNHNRCHLIDDTSSSPLSMQQVAVAGHNHLLPNSISIPVSLSNRFELTGAGRSSSVASNYETNEHRRLSSAESLLLLKRHEQQRQQRGSMSSTDCPLGSYSQYGGAAPCWPNLDSAYCPVTVAQSSICSAPNVSCFKQDASMLSGQHHPTPPVEFANVCRPLQQTSHDSPDNIQFESNDTTGNNHHSRQQQSVTRHRVTFDTSGTQQTNLN